MKTYISLLRGINVSGQKKIKMADLKLLYESLGLKNIVSYIQSGNVIFQSKSGKREKLEQSIQKAIFETFGFEVPVFVLEADKLITLSNANPFKDLAVEEKYLHLTLLHSAPEPEKIHAVSEMKFEGENFQLTKDVVYLYLPNGYGRCKLNNNFLESKLKVRATTRNLKTINHLLELVNI